MLTKRATVTKTVRFKGGTQMWRFISPPGNDSFQSGLIFCWRFFSFSCPREISELRRPIAAKFCIVIGDRAFGFKIRVKITEALPPKNLKAKTCKIWRDFERFQTLAANIFEMHKNIQNRTNTFLLQFLSRSAKKLQVNFGSNFWDPEV